MNRLIPHLRFNDMKCREALKFYRDIFGGELTFQTIKESPMANEVAPELHDRIIHATFKNDDFEIMASDMMRDKAIVGDNISLTYNCKSKEDIAHHFNALSKDGEIFMPLEKSFWNSIFGVVTDKYGIEWMLNYDLSTDK